MTIFFALPHRRGRRPLSSRIVGNGLDRSENTWLLQCYSSKKEITRHFFLLVQKEVAKEKHPKGGHASVSPFGIPPPGGDNFLGGASGRIYCPVPTKLATLKLPQRCAGLGAV